MKDFLTPEERAVLKVQHKHEKNRRVADRIKAVLLSDKGWTYRQIAEALLIDEQTISRHVDEYLADKKLILSSGGSKGKLNETQITEIEHHLESTTYLKVADIIAYIEKNYGVTFQMMSKISVKGDDIDPIYQWLTRKDQNGVADAEVKWNFQKFMIDENGKWVDFVNADETPMTGKIIKWIEGKQ